VEELGDEATVHSEQFAAGMISRGMTYRPMLPPPKWTAFLPVIVRDASCWNFWSCAQAKRSRGTAVKQRWSLKGF
jgi:hypothetical protein